MTSASTAPTTATSSPSSASTSNADTPPPASAQQEQQEQQEPAQQEPAQQSRRDEHPVSSAESMIPNAQELVAGVASPASTPTGSSGEQEEESGGDKGRAAPVHPAVHPVSSAFQDAQEPADVARAKKASLESLFADTEGGSRAFQDASNPAVHPVSSAESMIPNAQELVAGVASPASTPTGSSGEQEEESGGDKGRAAPVGTEGNKLVIFADTEGGSRALSLQDAQELADVARAKKASLESLKKSPDTLANQFFFMRGVTSFAEFIAKLKENAGNTTGSLYWIDEMGCSALCVILRNNVLVKLSGPYLCTASHITDFIFVESRYTR